MRPRIDPKETAEKKNRKAKALLKFQPISKPVPCEDIELGQIVLCKMRGYCPWPAIVKRIEKKIISIEFFGDRTSHKATIGSLFKFEESEGHIIENLRTKKTHLYSKAVQEAEIALGVPSQNSIFKQLK